MALSWLLLLRFFPTYFSQTPCSCGNFSDKRVKRASFSQAFRG
jgi:hypothetical protein